MVGRAVIFVVGVALSGIAALAQNGSSPSMIPAAVNSPQGSANPNVTSSSTAAAPPSSGCELHFFPAKNFIAMSSGMLSGFGVVGALADAEGHKDRVRTVKELMSDYLTPQVQLEELNKVGLAATLKMPLDTQIISEQPFPNPDDIKRDPTLKAKSQEAQAAEKAGKRLTSSTSTCYAELFSPYVFYQKAAMYGTRIFTSFVFRDFRHSSMPMTSKGQVENHVPNFPAVTSDQEEVAKTALIDAYGQDLQKWAELKLAK